MADFSKVPGIVKDLKGKPVVNGKYNNTDNTNESTTSKIEVISQGSAEKFRGTLNSNFDKIDREIDNVYKNMINIVVSNENESPIEYQKPGDFWFCILNE